jgi:hypothetical protein
VGPDRPRGRQHLRRQPGLERGCPALQKLHGGGAEAGQLAEYLLELLQEIREHARREQVGRR